MHRDKTSGTYAKLKQKHNSVQIVQKQVSFSTRKAVKGGGDGNYLVAQTAKLSSSQKHLKTKQYTRNYNLQGTGQQIRWESPVPFHYQ